MTSKKKQSLEIVKTNDVPEILKVIDLKLASLKAIEETPYKCGATLEGFGNVQSEMKIENLIRAYSVVRYKEKAYNEGAEDLGMKEYPAFNISGGNAEMWK